MNNKIQLRKAERGQVKLRIGLAGPSGSGKTYSSLLLARGMASDWDKIAIIDTENKNRATFTASRADTMLEQSALDPSFRIGKGENCPKQPGGHNDLRSWLL